MAGPDTQRQLLTLIRDFATEKSQGERRVAGLRKRIEELRSALDLTNAELENATCYKESAEQELKGYEVELTMNISSIQVQEARICLIQDEISKIGSEVEALKTEERVLRDEFIREMFEFNKTARKVQETMASNFHEDKSTKSSSDNGGKVEYMQAMPDIEDALKDLGDKLEVITSQTHREEQEYKENQSNHKKVQQELVEWEKKAFLIEAVVKETKELQELTRQTAELEQTCTAFGEELQRRCTCPRCHLDNTGALGGTLEENQES